MGGKSLNLAMKKKKKTTFYLKQMGIKYQIKKKKEKLRSGCKILNQC